MTNEEVQPEVFDDAVKVFQTAWAAANDHGLQGRRTRWGIYALINAGWRPATATDHLPALEAAKRALIEADAAGSDVAKFHARKDAVEALRSLIVAYEFVVNYGSQAPVPEHCPPEETP